MSSSDFIIFLTWLNATLEKSFNIVPENRPSQEEIHLPTIINHPLSGAMLVSGSVSIYTKNIIICTTRVPRDAFGRSLVKVLTQELRPADFGGKATAKGGETAATTTKNEVSQGSGELVWSDWDDYFFSNLFVIIYHCNGVFLVAFPCL